MTKPLGHRAEESYLFCNCGACYYGKMAYLSAFMSNPSLDINAITVAPMVFNSVLKLTLGQIGTFLVANFLEFFAQGVGLGIQSSVLR